MRYKLTVEDKLIVSKTIGNTGLPDFAPPVRTLHSNKEAQSVHTQVIYMLCPHCSH